MAKYNMKESPKGYNYKKVNCCGNCTESVWEDVTELFCPRQNDYVDEYGLCFLHKKGDYINGKIK
jgi:hypothetical protein